MRFYLLFLGNGDQDDCDGSGRKERLFARQVEQTGFPHRTRGVSCP